VSENSRQGKSHIDSIVKQEEDALQRRTRSEPEVEAFPAIKTRLLVPPKRASASRGETSMRWPDTVRQALLVGNTQFPRVLAGRLFKIAHFRKSQ
jgi:hypothetical protein